MRLRRLRRRDEGAEKLGASALTPLVDMLTLILLFLLQAWSADPPVLVPDEGFALPISASQEAVSPRLAIDVSEASIRVEGVEVVGTVFYEKSDEMLVREVYDPMLKRAGRPVALRVDADVPWVVVRKLLFTLQQAGVDDVALVAASRSSL